MAKSEEFCLTCGWLYGEIPLTTKHFCHFCAPNSREENHGEIAHWKSLGVIKYQQVSAFTSFHMQFLWYMIYNVLVLISEAARCQCWILCGDEHPLVASKSLGVKERDGMPWGMWNQSGGLIPRRIISKLDIWYMCIYTYINRFYTYIYIYVYIYTYIHR